jgi:hypothetical protein
LERTSGWGLSLLVEGATWLLGAGSGLDSYNKVLMRVMTRDTGEVLFSMRDSEDVIQELVHRAEEDLDRLDADAFAEKWGFKRS